MIDHPRSAANDNARGGEQRPTVVTAEGRPDHAYARRGNLILPLRFARRILGWQADRIELTGGAKRG